eukprot:CAMPEP_0201477002 /NCGR_PEP_ID=MMETSP0151_2-20130828/2129_1 /ASSEMBLY_ACC=CAM_ASM_000257 /TAXON_ID=200890 /ORGANISM="Paramoeba atlantica, Strain 621/1 / CCAP 1560/9" /LENGTH=370 /DNA_ID=CAMNT_0047857591 /DNA_START=65 /DNA_END=1173 /DNA_ORIENTATION=-
MRGKNFYQFLQRSAHANKCIKSAPTSIPAVFSNVPPVSLYRSTGRLCSVSKKNALFSIKTDSSTIASLPAMVRCTKCGRRFTTRQELETHTYRSHPPRTRAEPSTAKAQEIVFKKEQEAGTTSHSTVANNSTTTSTSVLNRVTSVRDLNAANESVKPAKTSSSKDGNTCILCNLPNSSHEELSIHKKSIEHRNTARDYFGGEHILNSDGDIDGPSELVQELLQKIQQRRVLEKELSELSTEIGERSAETPSRVATDLSQTTTPLMGIPLSYPYKFVPDFSRSLTSDKPNVDVTKESASSEGSCTSPGTVDKKDTSRFTSFVNTATLIGTVHRQILCSFRGGEPSAKFYVLVRRSVLSSGLSDESSEEAQR